MDFSSTHLLLDGAHLPRLEGAVPRVRPGGKLTEPVIEGREPWQDVDADPRAYVYGTALADRQGGYRLWYNRFHHDVLCAASADGLTWLRPGLDAAGDDGAGGDRAGGGALLNVEFHSPSVIRDDRAEPEQRYKMLGYRRVPEGRGYWVAHSADGLDWHYYTRNPVLEGGDTCTLSHDPATGQFLAFYKLNSEVRGHSRRLVYLSTSSDMQSWSEPELVMAPDEEDDERTRASGGICSHFYNMSAFRYGDQWLGLVTHFALMRVSDETGPNQSGHDGPIEAQLVHSRDGRTWRRCGDRSPLIANGPHEYDAGCILGVANQPVVAGDQMWLYYTAINTTHGGAIPPKQVAVARASWPRDRWVSLDAGSGGAVAETEPVRLGDGAIAVNAEARDGEVRVEVTDAAGAALPGFEAASCVPLRGDHLRHPVRWSGQGKAPADRPVRLRFLWENASLYSWRADTEAPPDVTKTRR